MIIQSLLYVVSLTIFGEVSASSSGSSSSSSMPSIKSAPESAAFTTQAISSLPESVTPPSADESSPVQYGQAAPNAPGPTISAPASGDVPPNAGSPVPSSIANNPVLWTNTECPRIQSTDNLKVHEMSGLWYVTARYPFCYNKNMDCQYMVINEVNSNEWNYDSHQYNTSTGQHKEETGTCTIDRSTSPQNIAATFSEPGVYLLYYQVLEIKYAQLAVLHACMYRGNQLLGPITWAITRTQYPTADQWKCIMKDAKEFGLDPNKLQKIDQSSCTAKVPNIPIPMAFHRKLSKNSLRKK